jgi:hypothetical protein
MNSLQVKRWRLGCLGVMVSGVILVIVYTYCRPHTFNESFWEHGHCIKQATMALQYYADQHGGRFPSHANGYGAALLLLPLDGTPWYAMTGPGYEGEVLRLAKQDGRLLTEDECGRVYVQGLTMKSNRMIAILFDKISTPGGDHCPGPPRLWASYGREVGFVDGTSTFIGDSAWQAFADDQIELLVREGFKREDAVKLYAQVQQ